MRPRKRKHPKYKAYFAHQLRRMQEKFPFLSTQQIKRKILSTWESFSSEKKDNWGDEVGKFSQASDGRKVSTSNYGSSPQHRRKRHTTEIPPHSSKSTKKLLSSTPINSTPPPRKTKDPPPKCGDVWPISEEYPPQHNRVYPTSEISPLPKRRTKNVRFAEDIQPILLSESLMENSESSMETTKSSIENSESSVENSESLVENSDSPLAEHNMCAISEEFNSISEHELVVEQETEKLEDCETSDDEDEDEEMTQEGNVWPPLFGDSTSVWKTCKKPENKGEKEQPLFTLFNKAEPGKYSTIRRTLPSECPNENTSMEVFEGDHDDDIFA